MDIKIPNPSVFLKQSPNLTASTTPPINRKPVKPRGPIKKQSSTDSAVTKPKQSKSRNGCMTCKKKRLKCDETKPTCAQCQKRNVVCEGYKKDYKWRTFEETTLNTRIASKKRSQTSQPTQDSKWSPNLESAFASASHAFQDQPSTGPEFISSSREQTHDYLNSNDVPKITADFSHTKIEVPSPGSSFDMSSALRSSKDYVSPHSSTSFSSGSPNLLDLLLPGTDLNQPPDLSEARPPLSPSPYQPGDSPGEADEADEEIVRHLPAMPESSPWQEHQTSNMPLSVSANASRSAELTIMASPELDLSSPEMLMLRFDRHTCGILSVKDGPTENPWRTLIWPLAKDSQALYHAISSMTAFHGACEDSQLRVAGVAHMTKSIRKLAADIENMRLDSALATSLALALGEGWDERTSTGIQHLRGAKIMVNSAMVRHRNDIEQGRFTPQDAVRLKFLCNTFIYLDVIARLTSNEEAQDLNFEDILMTVNQPTGDLAEVDPLMGCATTMFPLIARVANLIQKVRKTDSNSLSLVSQAMELKQQLLQWQTPNSYSFEIPEDPSSEVQHSIQTAEAYRYATLLYLHQAVSEIPAERAEILAKRVLMLLASVPLSSRTTIVQIFPLFAASCEVVSVEDRNWVSSRWAAMIARLKIGNVDSCWNVVREVWRRRDAFESEKAQRLIRRYTSRGLSTGSVMPDMPVLARRPTNSDMPFDQIEPEYTVRGKLHWLGVMTDWNWEVFLG